MRIIGYGEDALTYWALSRHMTEVISPPPINDDSPHENTLFIYRPSFGLVGERAHNLASSTRLWVHREQSI